MRLNQLIVVALVLVAAGFLGCGGGDGDSCADKCPTQCSDACGMLGLEGAELNACVADCKVDCAANCTGQTVVEDTTSGTDDLGAEGDFDMTEPDDDAGMACTNECNPIGESTCVDDGNYKVCQPDGTCLAWGTAIPCLADETCDAETGQCKSTATCQDECVVEGAMSCQGETSVLECQMGQDGCKHQMVIQNCTNNTTCQAGECKGGGGGDGGCGDIFLCQGDCGQNQQCAQGCVTQADATAQGDYQTVATCMQGTCGQFQNSTSKLFLCTLQSCSDQWGTCIGGYGADGCTAALQCAQGCGMDAGCQFQCIFDGSQAGQTAIWDMQACFEDNCSHCAQTDQQCLQTCAQQSCAQEMMACQTG